jgi:glycosyltransferase involved in cell wall biosynthesis
MRIALVRGPNLNPWELANFDFGEEVCAIASKRGAFDVRGVNAEVRRLACASDALRRLPPLLQAGVLRFTGTLDYLFGLERELAGFDIAHVAELVNPYSLQAIRARDRGACKRVVATAWENIALPPAENALVRRRVRAVAAGVDACVAVTEDARLHLRMSGVPEERIEVIPMGIDLGHFKPVDDRPADGPLRVLSVARLVAEKGVEDLVVAIALLAERGVEAQLTLVGTGPLRQRLEWMANELGVADRVKLAGPLPYDQMPVEHGQSDVFVLASAPRTTWKEQFGFAVVEAMASGLPVLAGRSGSLAEVVGDPWALVTPQDPVALADRLADLAADPELRRRKGKENRERAEERYDRTLAARRLRELYDRVLELPPRSGT